MSDIAKLMASLRRLPLRVVLAKVRHRIIQRAVKAIARRRALTVGLELTDAAFERALGARDGRDSWCRAFVESLGEKSIISQGPVFELQEVSRQRVLAAAAEAMRHRFDLLGSGPVHVYHGMVCNGRDGHVYFMPAGRDAAPRIRRHVMECLPGLEDYIPIDWHLDFISGYRWDEKTWHGDLEIGKYPGADIKVPWELGRHQHLVQIAKACALTGNRACSQEIQAQILDFIAANPVGFGPSWGCPMDVAIRACNWLVALSLLARQRLLDSGFVWQVARALVDHGEFVRSNLEWSAEVNGNHYVSNLAGLYFIGAMCPELPGSQSWRRFAKSRLEDEIHRQFYPDGANFEASTYYHRLVLEIFLFCAVAGMRTGDPFPESYLNVLRRAADVIRCVSFCSGEMTQIGDNDSGRFLVMDSLPIQSMRMDHILPLCDWMLGECGNVYREDVDLSPLAFLGGRLVGKLDDHGWQRRTGKHFANAGWVVLRDDRAECVVPCGDNGQGGNGGHAHNDKLSVAVAIGSDVLIVDPGTYIYTADAGSRNRYRSTRLHSTPQKDNLEINPIPSLATGLFTLPDSSGTRIDSVNSTSLEARHTAFGHPLQVKIEVRGGAVCCAYSYSGGVLTMRWYLAPGVEILPSDDGYILRKRGKTFKLSIDADLRRVGSYQFSAAYGRLEAAEYVEAGFIAQCSWSLQEAEP